MADTSAIQAIFDNQNTIAGQLLQTATDDMDKAFAALGSSTLYQYSPYQWQVPSAPIILGVPFPSGPARPGRPANPKDPALLPYATALPNPTFGIQPVYGLVPPLLTDPTQPGGEPSDNIGSAPGVGSPSFPGLPGLLSLPSSALPYPFITIPNAPVFNTPVFDGVKPDDITTMTVQQYLDQLSTSYTNYSQLIPALVQNNTMAWFRVFLNENPNVRLLDNLITTYLSAGGTGIPTPIEEAIITRAVDRVTADNRRANAAVWENIGRRGLTLPSGALMAGLKEGRQLAAEATSKVVVDVAIKNLDLEHDHMKFMLGLGVELQKLLLGYATETAKVVLEANGQAVDLTKLVLNGMIEANNMIVKVYLAKWEGYKAAVEVFRAKWMAVEMQIRVYEAQIKAEMAKTEINKNVVEVLRVIVEANKALVEQYKIQVDAETAKIETDRVRVMAYEAQVRGYVAKVEAWKVRWDGYRAQLEGNVAKSKVFESQNMGYEAQVRGYAAGITAYTAQVQGYTASVEATSRQNEAALKAFTVQLDGLLRAYGEDVKAYGANWNAIGEQMRASANVLGIQAEFATKSYSTQVQIDTERAREHLAIWRSQLEAGLHAAASMTGAADAAGRLAGSALNGLSAFAGTLATTTSA